MPKTKQKQTTKRSTLTKRSTKQTTKRPPAVRVIAKRAQSVRPVAELSPKTRARIARGVAQHSAPAPVVVETPRALSVDALPPALQTGQGRRWASKVVSAGWTVATMPARDFALMASAISRRAVESLFDTSWTAIATLRGFDPDAKKTRAPSAGRVGLGLSADEVATVRRARGERAPRVAVDAPLRALVDDAHLVVRIDSLPVGSTFKTADDVRVGVRGWTGTVARHGIGSTSVSGGRWDYIAPGAMVVPLVVATQQEAC